MSFLYEFRVTWLVFLCLLLSSPVKTQEDTQGPAECTLCPIQGSCPLALEKWELKAQPGGQAGRLPLQLDLDLRNPTETGQETRLMLVSEDGDASVRWNGFATTGQHLVIPSPTGSTTWSRNRLRVTIFSIILLGRERGQLSCNFKQPLSYLDRYRSEVVFLTPRRLQWAELGRGELVAQLGPGLQFRLGPQANFEPLEVASWPSRRASHPTIRRPIDSAATAVRVELRQIALPAWAELLCLGVPGPVLICTLVLLVISGRRGSCALAVLAGGLLTLLTNWVFQQVWGWPDFGLRYSPGTWREIYGYSTWIASPLVASLAIFFVWPWFVEHETQLLVGKHEGEQG